MYSSRRNSRTEPAVSAARCPTCGSSRVVRVAEDIVLTIGRRRHRFASVDHERRRQCGERIFGLASQMFDIAVQKGAARERRNNLSRTPGPRVRRGADPSVGAPAARGRPRLVSG